MSKKTIIIMIVLLVLILVAALCLRYFLAKPLYNPGDVGSGKNLRSPLTPPTQNADSTFWRVADDIEIYHFSVGTGRKVLVIHGGPGTPFTEPLIALAPLTKSFEFVYYHQRGCGQSTRPFDGFTSANYFDNMYQLENTLGIGAQLADIERIRQILGENQLILLGHSFGGFLAALYAAEFPEKVAGLILVAPANLLVLPADNGDLFEIVKQRLPESVALEFSDFQKRYFDFKNIFKKSEADLIRLNQQFVKYYLMASPEPEQKRQMQDRGEVGGGWMAFATYFSLGKKHDYRSVLSAVNTPPVLVIHGKNDLQPIAASKTYVEAFPDASFQLIEKAGHFPFHEQPEQFTSIVREYLMNLK